MFGFSSSSPTRRALVLARARLGRTLGARIGWGLAALGALILVSASLQGDEFAREAARMACWIGAGPAALAAAASPALRDRREGIETLALVHGIAPGSLARARVIASIIACAARVLVPVIAVGMTAVAVAPSSGAALRVLFSAIGGAAAGAVVGAVGGLSGELGRERGRALFSAVVFLPWFVAHVSSMPALSIPGALDAGLSFLARGVVG